MKKKTVSIGIPAYLEQATIKKLLTSLTAQKTDSFTLQEIIIVADGSTDKTVEYARQIKDSRIVIIDDKKRLGKSARLNQIFRMFTGDMLVLMDADIQILDKELLTKVVSRSDVKKAGIVAVNATPVNPNTYFEHIIDTSVQITKNIAEKWQNGDNYLSFKGCFLALDRDFAKSLQMPASIVNNDAYLYFAAKERGYKTDVCKNAVVYYKSPATLSDHLKQSSRYQSSEEELQDYFPNIANAYKIPFTIIFASTIKYLFLRPLSTLGYFVVRTITAVKRDTEVTSLWNIATTTKGA